METCLVQDNDFLKYKSKQRSHSNIYKFMKKLASASSKQPDRAQFWQEPDLGIEVLHAHYFAHSFARHSHSEFVISLIEGGAGSFWYKGCFYPSPPGHLVILNPDEPHTGQASSERG